MTTKPAQPATPWDGRSPYRAFNSIMPATPLPWDYASIENAIIPGAVLVDSEGDCICRVPLDKIDDTIYIVEACNAYPRLLAERAELVRVIERCQAALRANGAPNCEAMKESAEVLRKPGAE